MRVGVGRLQTAAPDASASGVAPPGSRDARGGGGAGDASTKRRSGARLELGIGAMSAARSGKLKVQHNRMGIVPGHYPQHYTDFKCELDVHDKREFLPALSFFVSRLPLPVACMPRCLRTRPPVLPAAY